MKDTDMFNFLKRKSALTEADLDVLSECTLYGITLEKALVVRVFLDWTQDPSTMNARRLGLRIAKQSARFKARFEGLAGIGPNIYSERFANKIIKQMRKSKMLKSAGRKTVADFVLSRRGERIRQFYVLKLNLRGSLLDRMHLFETA